MNKFIYLIIFGLFFITINQVYSDTQCEGDLDCDGVMDQYDECIRIYAPEHIEGFAGGCPFIKQHGCDSYIDYDCDGILDNVDECQFQYGFATQNGCAGGIVIEQQYYGPQWIMTIINWHDTKLIDDNTFNNAIEYLLKQNIIKIK